MSEAKHTPGPWKIAGGKGKHGDLYIWMDGDYFGGHAIATVHEEVQEGAMANAALIAAAPELVADLDVRAGNLEAIAVYLRRWLDNGATKPEGADTPTLTTMIEGLEICAAEARAIIAKAKGGE